MFDFILISKNNTQHDRDSLTFATALGMLAPVHCETNAHLADTFVVRSVWAYFCCRSLVARFAASAGRLLQYNDKFLQIRCPIGCKSLLFCTGRTERHRVLDA